MSQRITTAVRDTSSQSEVPCVFLRATVHSTFDQPKDRQGFKLEDSFTLQNQREEAGISSADCETADNAALELEPRVCRQTKV